MAASKSWTRVRLVVPTSTRRTPPARMMSGSRNEPPISTSCPRETSTSRPGASAISSRSTAPALLLTAKAASAPVSRVSRAATWVSRVPRAPSSKSYSRLLYERATCATWSTAASEREARPRLVCSITPVRLSTGRSPGRCQPASRAPAAAARASALKAPSTGPPARISCRVVSTAARMASTTCDRACAAKRGAAAGWLSNSSTAGNARRACWVDSSITFPAPGRSRPWTKERRGTAWRGCAPATAEP